MSVSGLPLSGLWLSGLSPSSLSPSGMRLSSVGGIVVVLGYGFMVADHLADDEVQEFFREGRVQLGVFGKPPQPGDLGGFASWVAGGKPVCGLEEAHLLRRLKPLREEVHEGCIDVVDAGPDRQQLCHYRRVHMPCEGTRGGVEGLGVRQVMV